MTIMQRVVSVLVLGALLSLCPLSVWAAEESAPLQGTAQQNRDYLIGAGDVLEIIVWREPDLSRTVRVRPDGKISLPLVDDVQAAHNTLPQLKKRLTNALAEFVENPSVYVMLEENRSKKVYLVGMITTPGEYLLEHNTTVLQAIASAGGFTEWASKDEIILLRHEGGRDKIYRINYKNIIKGKDFSQNHKLKAGDTIIVP